MLGLSDPILAALAGLTGGALLGFAGGYSRFCTLGAIEDAIYGNNFDRLRMWALGLAIAIAAIFGLTTIGQVDMLSSFHFTQAWNPLTSITGGLIFGYGMALSGNCGYGALVRMAGGDMRSFIIVLVMAISTYMALGGPTAALRNYLFPPENYTGDVPQSVAYLIGDIVGIAPLIPALVIALVFAILALSGAKFRRSKSMVFGGFMVGLAIASGWWFTTYLSQNSFSVIPIESHTFTAPLGDSVFYLMTSTGSSLNFGIGSVLGVIIGAFIGAKIKGRFRWESCDDPRELKRQILGAFLMGTGGVIALGCSIGQGMTAMSALTYSAPVVLASIFVGSAFGLRQLIRGFNAA